MGRYPFGVMLGGWMRLYRGFVGIRPNLLMIAGVRCCGLGILGLLRHRLVVLVVNPWSNEGEGDLNGQTNAIRWEGGGPYTQPLHGTEDKYKRRADMSFHVNNHSLRTIMSCTFSLTLDRIQKALLRQC